MDDAAKNYIKGLEESLNETMGWNTHFKKENDRLKELVKTINGFIEDGLISFENNNIKELNDEIIELKQRIKDESK